MTTLVRCGVSSIYMRMSDIRFLDALDTEMKDGDTLSVVPAIAGGR